MAQPNRPQLGRKDVICMTDNQGKNINSHLKYLILIAFPLQQWLHEHSSVLRYTFIICPVFENIIAAPTYNTE